MAACPYGALHFFEERGTVSVPGAPAQPEPSLPERYVRGAVSKCNYCVHKIDFGIENDLEVGVHPLATPACVVTCPLECRIFGDLDDPESNVNRYLDERGPGDVLRPDAKTGCSTQYVALP